jgi:hypothetical protein
MTGRYLAIAVSALLLVGASAHAAGHTAARVVSPAHGPSSLRAASHLPGGTVTAPHPAATRSGVAPVPTAIGARAAAALRSPTSHTLALPVTTPLVRAYNARVPHGSAKSGRTLVNATLGGPATFDARKLVRR